MQWPGMGLGCVPECETFSQCWCTVSWEMWWWSRRCPVWLSRILSLLIHRRALDRWPVPVEMKRRKQLEICEWGMSPLKMCYVLWSWSPQPWWTLHLQSCWGIKCYRCFVYDSVSTFWGFVLEVEGVGFMCMNQFCGEGHSVWRAHVRGLFFVV